jgi:hypothetical protein
MFISILYMFRAATCPSSGKLIVSIWHLVYVTLYRWPSGVQPCTPDGHLQSEIYQMSYWYNQFSWWWTCDCLKHVENGNKHIRKRTSWLFTRSVQWFCLCAAFSLLQCTVLLQTDVTLLVIYLQHIQIHWNVWNNIKQYFMTQLNYKINFYHSTDRPISTA